KQFSYLINCLRFARARFCVRGLSTCSRSVVVTLELPQARRLAMSVVLGQVVITVVAAIICFAVWGRVAGISAAAGGAISFIASAALALIGFASPAGAQAERVARAFYVGEGVKLGVTVTLFVAVFFT